MRSLRILCAEDHRDTADCLWRLLQRMGFDATVVHSYRDAVTAAKSTRFDVLLCDIGLPDGNGCDLLQELQALYPIPGVALSGYGMAQDVERCLNAGYLHHILKPASVQRIEEVLGGVARIVRGEGSTVSSPQAETSGRSQASRS